MKVTIRTRIKFDQLCTKTGDVCMKITPEYDGEWVYTIDKDLIGHVYLKSSRTGDIFFPTIIYVFYL